MQKLLCKYKIGTLHPDDVVNEGPLNIHEEESIMNRSKDLLVLQEFPFIAETNPRYLSDHFITPAEEMYIRNH